MEERVSIILKEEDQEALEKLRLYFRESIGIELNRTDLIRHCIRERIKVLLKVE